MTEKTIEEKIWDQLRLCYDYEIPVNIVELGLIYGFKIEELPESASVSPMLPPAVAPAGSSTSG